MALLFAHLEHQARQVATACGRAITQRWYGFDNYEQGDYLAADRLADAEAEQEVWDESDVSEEAFDAMWAAAEPVGIVDPRRGDSATPEDTKIFRDRIAELIWQKMIGAGTGTSVGSIQPWIRAAANAIWDEYTCRRCSFGIADLGVYERRCNDCAPRLAAESRLKTSAESLAAETDPAVGGPPAATAGSPIVPTTDACCVASPVVGPPRDTGPTVRGEGSSADSDIPGSPAEEHPTVPAGLIASEARSPAGLTWAEWAVPAICEVLAEHRVVNNKVIDGATYCCDEDGAIHDEFGTTWEWREHVAPLIAERIDTAWRAKQSRNK